MANRLKDLPDTRKAFEEGEITFGHAKIIAKTSERVNIDEQALVARARKQPVDMFARTARRHEQRQSGDDGVSRLEAQKRMRRAWIGTDRDDGMTVLYARFDPITGARVKNALSTRSDLLWREEDPKHRPSTEQRPGRRPGTVVVRTPQHRKEREGQIGSATLFIMANYDTVSQQLRDAGLVDGTPYSRLKQSRIWRVERRSFPAFFGLSPSTPVGGIEQTTRYPNSAYGPVRPPTVGAWDVTPTPEWCQAHHVIPWQADGPTPTSTTYACCGSRCHHQVHDNGWQIRQTPRGKHVMLPPTKKNRPPLPVTVPQRRRKLTTNLRR